MSKWNIVELGAEQINLNWLPVEAGLRSKGYGVEGLSAIKPTPHFVLKSSNFFTFFLLPRVAK